MLRATETRELHGGRWVVVVFVLGAVSLSGCGSSSVPVPPVRGDVTVATLKAMMADGQPLVIADVRRPESFADGHIPGSTNVPAEEVAAWGRTQPAEARICCVCDTGAESAAAADILAAQGHRRVSSLVGGLDQWDGALEPPPFRHDITGAQLKSMMADGRPLTVVDVGSPYAYSLKHIPGSINLPLEEIEIWAQNLLPYRRVCVGCT